MCAVGVASLIGLGWLHVSKHDENESASSHSVHGQPSLTSATISTPLSTTKRKRTDDRGTADASTRQMQREIDLKEACQLRLEERAEMIAERLQLDDNQRQRVLAMLQQFTPNPILLAQVEGLDTAEADAMRQYWSLQSHQAAEKFERSLLTVISPEQQQKWSEFQTERRQNQIETAALSQLARLQQHLTLENSQKDEVYRILTTQQSEQQQAPAELLLSPTYNDANATLQSEQLQQVLTPAQIAIYQSLPQLNASVNPAPLFDFSDLAE